MKCLAVFLATMMLVCSMEAIEYPSNNILHGAIKNYLLKQMDDLKNQNIIITRSIVDEILVKFKNLLKKERLDEFFDIVDSNKDGVIDAAEIKGAVVLKF